MKPTKPSRKGATLLRRLKRLLHSKADAFLSNDYYESDIAWMELDSKLDVTIGPYETAVSQGQQAAKRRGSTTAQPSATWGREQQKEKATATAIDTETGTAGHRKHAGFQDNQRPQSKNQREWPTTTTTPRNHKPEPLKRYAGSDPDFTGERGALEVTVGQRKQAEKQPTPTREKPSRVGGRRKRATEWKSNRTEAQTPRHRAQPPQERSRQAKRENKTEETPEGVGEQNGEKLTSAVQRRHQNGETKKRKVAGGLTSALGKTPVKGDSGESHHEQEQR
ncbi:hypothetical protein V2J09_004702 [Rumex salicifolius]